MSIDHRAAACFAILGLVAFLAAYPAAADATGLIRATVPIGDDDEDVVYEGLPEDFPLSSLRDDLSISPVDPFRWVDWTNLTLKNVDVSRIHLNRIKFDGMVLENFRCEDCSFRNVSVEESRITDSEFGGGTFGVFLHDSALSGLRVSDSRVYMMDIYDTVVEDSILSNVSFSGRHKWHGLNVTGSEVKDVSISTLELLDSMITQVALRGLTAGHIIARNSAVVESDWGSYRFDSLRLSSDSDFPEFLQEVARISERRSRWRAVRAGFGGFVIASLVLALPYLMIAGSEFRFGSRLIPLIGGSILVVALNISRNVVTSEGGSALAQSALSHSAWLSYASWWNAVPAATLLFLVLLACGIPLACRGNPRGPMLGFLAVYLVTHMGFFAVFWCGAPSA